MGAGKPKKTKVSGPIVNLPKPGDDIDVEEAQAAAVSYGYLSKWQFPNGSTPGPKLGSIMKKQLKDLAIAVPWFAEKAEELGLDPHSTTIGAVFALAMVQKAVRDPGSPAARELLNRVDGLMKGGMDITSLKTVQHQVALEGLPDQVLDALLERADVIDGCEISDTDDDEEGEVDPSEIPMARTR